MLGAKQRASVKGLAGELTLFCHTRSRHSSTVAQAGRVLEEPLKHVLCPMLTQHSEDTLKFHGPWKASMSAAPSRTSFSRSTSSSAAWAVCIISRYRKAPAPVSCAGKGGLGQMALLGSGPRSIGCCVALPKAAFQLGAASAADGKQEAGKKSFQQMVAPSRPFAFCVLPPPSLLQRA